MDNKSYILGTMFFFSFMCFVSFIIIVFSNSSVASTTNFENPIYYLDNNDTKEITSFEEPIEVDQLQNKEIIDVRSSDITTDITEPKLLVYGNLTYVERNDGLLERNGDLWRRIRVTTTAYTWKDDGYDPSTGAGDGKTSIGVDAIRTYGFATCPRAIPTGSTLHVSGYGVFKVDDTGGALRQAWRRNREIIVDLRIPQLRYDGVWRSVNTIRRIALRHGRRRNRIILLKVN